MPNPDRQNPESTRMFEALEREAHVYLARPEEISANRLASYTALLSESERARHKRFHFDVHRRLYLVSHVLTRTTLSRYVSRPAASWEFVDGEYGRPEIVGAQNEAGLRFNLSHTENLAAVVVCRDRDCGVDVERLDRVKDLAGVARRVFTAPELHDLGQREGADLQGRFTDYWTLKEAYMKARGMGFQLPPETFTMRIDPSDDQRAELEVERDFDDRGEAWQFERRSLEFADPPHYRLAVAIRNDGERERKIGVHAAELP